GKLEDLRKETCLKRPKAQQATLEKEPDMNGWTCICEHCRMHWKFRPGDEHLDCECPQCFGPLTRLTKAQEAIGVLFKAGIVLMIFLGVYMVIGMATGAGSGHGP